MDAERGRLENDTRERTVRFQQALILAVAGFLRLHYRCGFSKTACFKTDKSPSCKSGRSRFAVKKAGIPLF